jgi:hypothetical protein
MAGCGAAGRGWAWLGRAGQGAARQGFFSALRTHAARLGWAWRGLAGHGRAGRGKARFL